MGKINYESIANQRILREFVNLHVSECMTDIVDYILQKADEFDSDAPFSRDDIENQYYKSCPECDGDLKEIEVDDVKYEHVWICQECGERFKTKEEALHCCYAEDEDVEEVPDEDEIIKEAWICSFCDEEFDTEEEAKDCSCTYGETLYKCESCGEYVLESNADEKMNEVYEWYLVDDFLADKLAQQGEMVIKGYHNFWGRGGCGQAIYMDTVFGRIAEDLEILEGQACEWKD